MVNEGKLRRAFMFTAWFILVRVGVGSGARAKCEAVFNKPQPCCPTEYLHSCCPCNTSATVPPLKPQRGVLVKPFCMKPQNSTACEAGFYFDNVRKQVEPCPDASYTVIPTDRSSIAARRITDGREVYRDASHFQNANALIQDNTSEEREDQEEPSSEDWREKILLNANPKSVQEEIITSTEEVVETSSSDKIENKPPELSGAASRPRRDRRRPDYLKDYVI